MTDQPNNDLAVPAFLRRTRENTPKAPPLKPVKWEMPDSVKKQMARKAKRKAREDARRPVLWAVQGGADTVGKIRKVTELETSIVQGALKHLIKVRQVAKVGRRYLEF
jgi:hypothetical protein